MTLTPVDSSNIAAIGHDPATNTLHVEFKGTPRRTYAYQGITAAQHEELINAPSIGKHFHQHIKGSYTGRRIA